MVCAQMIEMLRTTRDVRHKLQENAAVSSVFTHLSVRSAWVEPIEHVFSRNEEIEGRSQSSGERRRASKSRSNLPRRSLGEINPNAPDIWLLDLSA